MRHVKSLVLSIGVLFCGILYFGYGGSESAAQQMNGGQDSSTTLVLRGGRLIDGTGRTPIENSVVLVQGSKIVSVGKEGDFAIPAGAKTIDTTGKTVIPGLTDAHIHLRNNHMPLFLYWGVTTVVDYRNVTSWLWAERDAVEKGAVVGPNIFIHYALDSLHPKAKSRPPSGKWASERWGVGSGAAGRRGGMDLFGNGNYDRRWVSDAASIEEAVQEAKRARFDAIQLYQSVPTPLMKTAVDIAHRQGNMPVIGQFTSPSIRRGTDEILDTGIDVHVEMHGIELATTPDADQEKVIKEEIEDPAYLMNPDDFPTLASKMVERRMALAPTFVHFYAEISKYREEFDRTNTTFLMGPVGALAPGREELLSWNKPYEEGKHKREMEQGWKKVQQFTKIFAEKGGRIVAGTGAPAGGAPGVSLHNELRMITEAGLTPMQAIQSATLYAMQAYRKDKDLGSIEPGKIADIVILNRNPLEDISAVRDIHTVIKSGTVVNREALAQWKDPFPQPNTADDAETMLQVPLIDELSPFAVAVVTAGTNVPEVIVKGGNFTPQSRVMFNAQFVPTKFYDSNRLGATIDGTLLKSAGTYPIAVVQPGSGGGVSNLWYLFVTHGAVGQN